MGKFRAIQGTDITKFGSAYNSDCLFINTDDTSTNRGIWIGTGGTPKQIANLQSYVHPVAGTGDVDIPTYSSTKLTFLTRAKIDSSGHVTDTIAFNGTVGSSTQPIYFSSGFPTALNYTIAKSVPSDAIFTDKNVTDASGTGKSFILGHATQGTTATATTNSGCYMNDGYLYSNGVRVIPGYVRSKNTISKIFLVGTETQSASPIESFSRSTVYIDAQAHLVSTGGFYESSDERLKNFNNKLEIDLDKLSNLKKSYFTFKDNPDKNQIGISAQEIQKLYPEIVNETDEGYLIVDYSKLSVIALAAIDKLNDEIKELKKFKEEITKTIN